MFRSGRLTRARLNQIMRWVERMPHNLRAVAKACAIYPSDLLAWYAAGQDAACTDPLMVELAWRVAEVRAEAAAKNYDRIVAAADGGTKRKRVEKKDAAGVVETIEEHVETVLPASWAIEKLEELAGGSAWEIAPDQEQAAELHRMMKELTPTPLLGVGQDEANVGQIADGPVAGGNSGREVELSNRAGEGFPGPDSGAAEVPESAVLDAASVRRGEELVAGQGGVSDAKGDDVLHE